MTVPVTPIHGFKLGKTEARPPALPEFKTYFAAGTLEAPPPQAHYAEHITVPWGMDGNGPDPLVTLAGVPAGWGGCGDCVECLKAHYVILGNYDEDGHTVPVPTANEVVSQYCNYQKCTPDQLFTAPDTYDNGEDIQTSLTGWTKTVQYDCKLGLYAPVSIKSQQDLMQAVYLGGGAAIGIQCPESAEEQWQSDGLGYWTPVANSPIIGGHGIVLCGYWDGGDKWSAVSWGAGVRISWAFLQEYMDEAYALESAQAIAAGKGPTGLADAALAADIATLD